MRRRRLVELVGQPTRFALLDLVRRAPGLPVMRAATALGVDYSTIQYHARVLERHGALTVAHVAGALRLYPPGAAPAPPDRARLDALASETARDVANSVLVRGAATLREVMTALDIPRSTAQQHLKRLAEAGVLDERPEPAGATVFAVPDSAS